MAKRKKNDEKNIETREEIIQPKGLFGGKCILELKELKKAVSHCKGLGMKIILTMGSWDMVHIGHARYFMEAKKHGDVLVVGVDSDEKIKIRKGPDRPIVPQNERMEMVAHLRYVDLVVLKEHSAPKWHLIKLVMPDVLIATKETYTEEQVKALKKYCGEVVVLEPRATTSTSAKIRRMQISTAKKLEKRLTPRILKAIETSLGEIKEEKLKK
ncbi:MAG TPA: adenylyltransferase/cytidyltransferase family protein [Candidatus Moranbacteria bacterium]|nr:adenylyltransferase/cytidyltransferase family protein [Candidatus Moranbacteria bacterium]